MIFQEIGLELACGDEERVVSILQASRPELAGLSTREVGQAVSRGEVYPALASLKGLAFLPDVAGVADRELVAQFDMQLLRMAELVPLHLGERRVAIALGDPYRQVGVDHIRQRFPGYSVDVYFSPPGEIARALSKCVEEESSFERLDGIEVFGGGAGGLAKGLFALDMRDGHEIKETLRSWFNTALSERASDIAIQMDERRLWVRFRVEGYYRDGPELPRKLKGMLDSVLLQMIQSSVRAEDVNDRTSDVSGRMTLVRGGGKSNVDVRYERLRTNRGYHVTLRLLDKGAVEAKLGVGSMDFGMPTISAIRRTVAAPEGLVLITGPTGSGKSTTISAILREIACPDEKIITLEDPVEDEIPGVVHCDIGDERLHERFMRSSLRSDPDVIFCGEMRDLASGNLALKAAMTGHLTFSTLHANSTADAVLRLQHMGLERWMFAGVLIGVGAQRLVKLLCQNCRVPVVLTAERCVEVGLNDRFAGRNIFEHRAGGCPVCHGGYFKRAAVLEFVQLGEGAQAQLAAGAEPRSVMDAQRAAHQLPRLRDQALDLLWRGASDLAAISKVVRISDV